MVERKEVWLDADDTIAAMQILACIARPNRPDLAGELMQQWFWARKRHRREQVPDLPFRLKKKGEIERQLGALKDDVLQAFIAARWFNRMIQQKSPNQSNVGNGLKKTSLRKMAGVEGKLEPQDNRIGNVITKIWTPRRPVLHMALAAGSAIVATHTEGRPPSMRVIEIERQIEAILPSCQSAMNSGSKTARAVVSEYNRLLLELGAQRRRERRQIELEAVIFDPSWLDRALHEAEECSRTAVKYGVLEPSEPWLFRR